MSVKYFNTDYKNISYSIYNEESVELGILSFSKEINADLDFKRKYSFDKRRWKCATSC